MIQRDCKEAENYWPIKRDDPLAILGGHRNKYACLVTNHLL